MLAFESKLLSSFLSHGSSGGSLLQLLKLFAVFVKACLPAGVDTTAAANNPVDIQATA